jgi:BirA family transcriptional regulator, biotin operon repressor / biotin---[acetyl-CoA-carboxylase] ligase
LYKIPANTLFIGQSLVYVPECHSTNAEAVRLLQANAAIAEGTVVLTDNQTAGRGQRGNTWESEPGKNLTFSLILKPVFLLAKDQFKLNMAISLALHDYLREQVPHAKIKWPNDMMLDTQKTCGILIENQLAGQTIQHSIVGIGLNVNQQRFALPTATSVAIKKGYDFVLNDVLAELLQCIEARYLQLRAQISLTEEYLAALFGMNEQREFAVGEDVFEGVITGVDTIGRLEVDVHGSKRYFDLKEVRFL